MKRITKSVTTAATAAAVDTAKTSGKLYSITYVPDGTNPYPNTVDITITLKATGEAILSRSNVAAGFTAYPRAAVATPAGAAALYAAAGEAVLDKIAIGNDQFHIVLAEGGDAKTGVFHFLVD